MRRRSAQEVPLTDDPLWYKDAIIYELHVRAFMDSNGDGIGDFRGLMEKLDYIQELGVTAIWLLPFYPSPGRDDGYDIADYGAVNPAYGTLRDFREFIREAHRRGLRVITELVINHTSSEHPWFQRARRAPSASRHRDFYVWSDTPERYRDARIIFSDFETSNWTWDPVARAYYWHRFYSHQPDLNFDNPSVQRAVFKVLDFWMDMGVDGMRLDAVPYLYEREGTNCENLTETHTFLKKLRRHIDGKYKNRMLLAEANQWPEDAAAYFGDGDECHMNFHFPVMPRMFMAVHLENSFPIIDIMRQTPKIHENCQWAVFLRNHDELTLEMVTDEDRDYMYRVYAEDPQARINFGIRRRLAPLLKDRKKLELMNALLLSLPGTPVLYYGDEIGQGDNIYLGDRNGVRTPMQWSGDRNAGFSRANPQKLFLPVIIDPEYHFEAVNVEAQHNNLTSIWWWMKRIIALRRNSQVFGRGDIEFIETGNAKVLVFLRSYHEERVLVVANLSRFVQCVELELKACDGFVPVEMFGHNAFPRIGKLPYFLTLGPHSFYWFALAPPEREAAAAAEELASLTVEGTWEQVFVDPARSSLEEALPDYIRTRRWFRGKAQRIKQASIEEAIPIPVGEGRAAIAVVRVDYVDEPGERYVMPLIFSAVGGTGEPAAAGRPRSIVARLDVVRGKEVEAGVLEDASLRPDFTRELLAFFGRKRTFLGEHGRIQVLQLRGFRQMRGGPEAHVEPVPGSVEQSNTSITYGDRFVLKLYRKLESGTSPEVEMSRFLVERVGFSHIPSVVGLIEYTAAKGPPTTMGLLQQFVPNQGDAWRVTLDALERYYERALAYGEPTAPEMPHAGLVERARQEVPAAAAEVIGPYLFLARQLGTRTAELHLALASAPDNPAFAPEPLSLLYQRSLYQAGRGRLLHSIRLLKRTIHELPEDVVDLAQNVLGREGELDARLKRITRKKIEGLRIRCHGDYHLGQVLYTGKDFMIIDFEGEPARSIGERRFKWSPLRDVSGMLRSFHYASVFVQRRDRPRDETRLLEPWAALWTAWVSAVFLRSYFEAVASSRLLPASDSDLAVLLDYYLVEKGLYELGYELNNRPDWVIIPLDGLRQILAYGEV